VKKTLWKELKQTDFTPVLDGTRMNQPERGVYRELKALEDVRFHSWKVIEQQILGVR